ncbi:hypothetical protein GCM10009868_36670 [Terrabacter aerolatus]|uniref:Uncharacterized protein n=1 Tax=Terrabacter aerolatus TaxID=422442 RepID=A0A512CWH5_9MICO|nr:hypothetical protein TAE01_01600 [Terrabacter aerolatus]
MARLGAHEVGDTRGAVENRLVVAVGELDEGNLHGPTLTRTVLAGRVPTTGGTRDPRGKVVGPRPGQRTRVR